VSNYKTDTHEMQRNAILYVLININKTFNVYLNHMFILNIQGDCDLCKSATKTHFSTNYCKIQIMQNQCINLISIWSW